MDGLLGIAYRLIDSNKQELSYEDEILLNDDLSESSLAYAVPHDSVTSREAQGAVSPAKSCPDCKGSDNCRSVPFDAPCIGCGNCRLY